MISNSISNSVDNISNTNTEYGPAVYEQVKFGELLIDPAGSQSTRRNSSKKYFSFYDLLSRFEEDIITIRPADSADTGPKATNVLTTDRFEENVTDTRKGRLIIRLPNFCFRIPNECLAD